MRQITKDISLKVDGQEISFRLIKLDAFSGVALLRLLMRLEDERRCHPEQSEAASKDLTLLDLVASLSDEELRSVMTSVLNHVSVLLPAGPHPVMTGSEWGYPELEHDTPSCMKLLLEGISWSLSGFFGEGQSKEAGSAPVPMSP
jgi:hypothetical protein